MEKQWRKVFVITESGEQEINFMELKKGDLFRLVDPDGTPVKFKGKEILEALGDPFTNRNDIPEIHLKDYDPEVLH